jgi:hypothetical protein
MGMGRSRSSDLPTVPPPFNAARFAKDSDAKIALKSGARDAATGDPPQSEMRIATRPRLEAVDADEIWAQGAVGVLVVQMSTDELKRLPLDHRAGYLLSRIDGTMDLETLVEVASLSRQEVLRMVRDLLESGVVAFRQAPE